MRGGPIGRRRRSGGGPIGRRRRSGGGGTALVIVPDYHPTMGGTTRQASTQARGLADSGVPVAIVTRRYQRSWRRREVVDGLAVRRFGPPGRTAGAEKLALLALWLWLVPRRRRVRSIQTLMYADFAAVAVLAGLGSRTTVVWAAHGEATDVIGPAPDPLRRLQRRARRALIGRCQQVALTEAMRRELLQLGARRVEVIPVPVDGHRFRPPTAPERERARRALGFGEDDLVVAYTGRFDAAKGLDRLVAAGARLVDAGAPVRLLLVGGGDASALGDAIDRYGMAPRVVLPGVVEDVERYLWGADVFVLPSVREGLSNSLAEAMACGLACVASVEAGGDQVLGGGAGVVPPTSSVDDLAAALLELAGDRARCRQLGRRAAQRAEEFRLTEVTRRYQRLAGTPLPAGT
ncbi:MAG TPA: glycosyltransferase family 4 protein [Acidimicrobiales bacterium]|nr:glycosyltransferase family 4 protein [Acidimicrobiales bacterium]